MMVIMVLYHPNKPAFPGISPGENNSTQPPTPPPPKTPSHPVLKSFLVMTVTFVLYTLCMYHYVQREMYVKIDFCYKFCRTKIMKH